MRFLFLQQGALVAQGPMIISAVLKSHGHEVALLIDAAERQITRKALAWRPDVVGSSCYTGQYRWTLDRFAQIRSGAGRDAPLCIAGGPHATFCPELVEHPAVDIVARGECEGALLELLDRLRDGREIASVPNLWVKQEGRITRNELAPLEENLDRLPPPDRELYYERYAFLRRISVKHFLTGRGCPLRCGFCQNTLSQELYRGKGTFVRRRSPESVVAEIAAVRDRYGLRTTAFADELFPTNIGWLEAFLPLYEKEIGLPFVCNVMVKHINERQISLLRQHGCFAVKLGLESGNERLRRGLLEKDFTDGELRAAAAWIKKAGILLSTENILGLPGETLEQAWQTLDTNVAIGADHAACSLLQPYPWLPITRRAIEQGYLPATHGIDDVGGGQFRRLAIRTPDSRRIVNLQRWFGLAVLFPSLRPAIRPLLRLPPNHFLALLGDVVYGYSMTRVHRLTLPDVIRYGIRMRAYDF